MQISLAGLSNPLGGTSTHKNLPSVIWWWRRNSQQSTYLRRKRNVALHSMFSPWAPEWVKLNSRKRNVAHRLRTCEGRTPPAGGFLPAVLFVFEITTREWEARFLVVIFYRKYLLSSTNLFQTQRYDGHGSRWNVGMEMYDKHGLRSPFLPLKSFQLMLVCKTSQSSPWHCLIIF